MLYWYLASVGLFWCIAVPFAWKGGGFNWNAIHWVILASIIPGANLVYAFILLSGL